MPVPALAELIGQPGAREFLERTVESGRIANAYLTADANVTRSSLLPALRIFRTSNRNERCMFCVWPISVPFASIERSDMPGGVSISVSSNSGPGAGLGCGPGSISGPSNVL